MLSHEVLQCILVIHCLLMCKIGVEPLIGKTKTLCLPDLKIPNLPSTSLAHNAIKFFFSYPHSDPVLWIFMTEFFSACWLLIALRALCMHAHYQVTRDAYTRHCQQLESRTLFYSPG